MTADADPAIHRHALRRRIERARIEGGDSYGDLAGAMGWTLSDLLLVAAVADGIDDGRLQALMDRLGITAGASSNVQAPPVGQLSEAVRVLVEYERLATSISTFEPFVIPGLLQTRAYAESVLRFYAPPEGVGPLVDARLVRQDLFQSADRPEMIFLIDESALHRWAGTTAVGSAVIREQLEYIRQIAQYPGVRIEVVPYAAGVHEGVKGSFVILESADPLLYLEDAKGDVISVDRDRVQAHRDRFGRLLDAATGPEGLADLLRRVGENRA